MVFVKCTVTKMVTNMSDPMTFYTLWMGNDTLVCNVISSKSLHDFFSVIDNSYISYSDVHFSKLLPNGPFILYEPWHGFSKNVVWATSKASDQPAHTRSLIRAFASRLSIIWVLSY